MWIVGLVVGLVALISISARITRWRRIPVRLTQLAVGLYGFVPAIALKSGVTATTAIDATMAIIYFLVFSVVGAVTLNGIVARADYQRRTAGSG
jgi:hypothetical protein